jgi:hypothetical protein
MAGPPCPRTPRRTQAPRAARLVVATQDPESLHPPSADGFGGVEVALGVQVQGVHVGELAGHVPGTAVGGQRIPVAVGQRALLRWP